MVAESQLMAGRVLRAGRTEAKEVLTRFVHDLPGTSTRLEWRLQRSLLVDVAYRCGSTLHRRAHHSGSASQCRLMPAAFLDRLLDRNDGDVRSMFLDWIEAFFAAIDRIHPPTPADRAAALIKADYSRRWSLAALAARSHSTPSTLRRGFRRQFQMSPSEYQRMVRVAVALDKAPSSKIEAVAREVGYRSSKNLYRAFVDSTGLTVGAYRGLSAEQAASVKQRVELRLIESRR